MYTKISDFLNENISINYMLGDVKYSWLKNIIKEVSGTEPKDKTRLQILSENKDKLRLDEFQKFYDYWNFCDINSGQFKIANNPVERYKKTIIDWVWYLTLCQLFKKELEEKNIFTDMYNEISKLPNLSGDLEKDKIIFFDIIKDHFMKSSSATRQGIILYDSRFSNNRIF